MNCFNTEDRTSYTDFSPEETSTLPTGVSNGSIWTGMLIHACTWYNGPLRDIEEQSVSDTAMIRWRSEKTQANCSVETIPPVCESSWAENEIQLEDRMDSWKNQEDEGEE
jgi:hypothetical protein